MQVSPGHAVVTTTQKATFTVHEISVSVNMCFWRLHYMISRFARSDLDFPNLGIRKLCYANGSSTWSCGFPTTAWTLFSVIRQTRRSRNHNVLCISCNASKGVFSILALQTIKWMLAINANNYVFVRHVSWHAQLVNSGMACTGLGRIR